MGQHSKPGKHSKPSSKTSTKQLQQQETRVEQESAAAPAPKYQRSRQSAPSDYGRAGIRRVGYEQEQAQLEEREKKSKRSRILLIVGIVLIAALLVAGIVLGIGYISKHGQEAGNQTPAANVTVLDPATDTGTVNSTAVTQVPKLASFIGMDGDQAIKSLGDLVMYSDTSDTTDESNPAITQITEIKVAPTGSTADDSFASGAATVYLSQDSSGKVLEVYYVVSLDALGNGERNFGLLLKDSAFFESCMTSAGVKCNASSFPVPTDASAYEIYADDGNGGKALSKSRYSWTNGTGEDSPSTWTLGVSFDYSLTSDTPTVTNRLLSISIS
ncbi:MAG: hypothetical protein IJH83_00100 [Coriobacteriales bacterium]|nr:hypothetical protein [Coriobacteriales bacterium]